MEELMSFFPEEVASHIIQYTYRFQSKSLLDDIVNFTQSKARVLFLYFTYFTIREEVNDYKDWISNDIVYFMNNFHHTGVVYGGGYVDKFYTRWSRNPLLNTREKIDKYVIRLGTPGFDNVAKEANLYLGLMLIEERREFIEWVIQCYGELFEGETFLALI
jgi:hypothetical protein